MAHVYTPCTVGFFSAPFLIHLPICSLPFLITCTSSWLCSVFPEFANTSIFSLGFSRCGERWKATRWLNHSLLSTGFRLRTRLKLLGSAPFPNPVWGWGGCGCSAPVFASIAPSALPSHMTGPVTRHKSRDMLRGPHLGIMGNESIYRPPLSPIH